MDIHREETRLVAERAAQWCCRLRTADLGEKAEFLRWLKQSPKNVREMLIALAWDELLHALDPGRQVNVETLAATTAKVINISE